MTVDESVSPPDRAGRLRWVVVVPVKGSTESKSRLASFPLSAAGRRELALAFARDSVSAILRAPDVRAVVVVTADAETAQVLRALGAEFVADPGSGLNAAVEAGLRFARETYPHEGVAAITADLPTLRTADVSAALRAAAQHPLAFVPDLDGVGTTTLTALPGRAPHPHFGGASARAHTEAGFTALDIAPSSTLRRDVDTPADLEAAARLGLGPHTAAAFAALVRPAAP